MFIAGLSSGLAAREMVTKAQEAALAEGARFTVVSW